MATQHFYAEESDGRNSAQQKLVLIFAAMLGATLGLAWSISPYMRGLLGEELDYPVKFPLPDAVIAAPAIDVLRTDGPAGAGTAPPSDQVGGGDIQRTLESTSEASASGAAAQAPEIGPGGILALDYDLTRYAAANSGYDRNDGSIETTMPLLLNGKASGNAQIRIVDNAQIQIATRAVANAVGERRAELGPRLSSALESGTGFLPFHELRAAGINVQYDPVNNRIALTLPS